MIKSFDHTAFIVRDLEAMIAFYRDVLGLTVQWEYESQGDEQVSKFTGLPDVHMRIVYLGLGEKRVLELIQYLNPQGIDVHGPPNALGGSHVCFLVEDLEGWYPDLKRLGLRFAGPLLKGEDLGVVVKACYAQDPEGNWLEFMEMSPKAS